MKKVWMVAAAATVAFGMNAQDASIETQAIGLVIDAHAFVLKSCYWVVFTDAVLIEINTYSEINNHTEITTTYVLLFT
jgi:hypothetical protein